MRIIYMEIDFCRKSKKMYKFYAHFTCFSERYVDILAKQSDFIASVNHVQCQISFRMQSIITSISQTVSAFNFSAFHIINRYFQNFNVERKELKICKFSVPKTNSNLETKYETNGNSKQKPHKKSNWRWFRIEYRSFLNFLPILLARSFSFQTEIAFIRYGE